MRYDDREARGRRPKDRLLLGAALGAVAGAAGLAYWQSARDRDGLARRPADSAPGSTARQRGFGRYAVTSRSVTIGKPRREIYDFWRDFSNLAGVMENVHEVETRGDLTLWTIRGPGERALRLETRIVSDRPGEEIAWASTEASQIETRGKVLFRDAPGGRGTELEAVIAYVPPAGALGRTVARLFQAEPALQGRRDLRRLKMKLETGEIATSANRREI